MHSLREASTGRDIIRSGSCNPLLDRAPGLWQEREILSGAQRKYDKGFACEWISDRLVVVGTKCNHLLCLDVATGRMAEVPLPPARHIPPRADPHAVNAQSNGLSPVTGNCGIHAIAFSPNRRLMATGGNNPAHCQVFEVDVHEGRQPQACFRPVQTLMGHQDWIFGIAWVTDRHLVTGSRDRTAKLWHVDEQPSAAHYTPLQSQSQKDEVKVRDVKYQQSSCRVLTLTTNGFVQIWDPHLNYISQVQLPQNKEAVCMAVCDQLAAVGTQSYITLMDPRCRLAQADIPSSDPHHGVRSLSIQGHLLSCGSGRGQLAFWDLRAGRYLELHPSPGEDESRSHLQLGRGWLMEDSIYWEHFTNVRIHNACYAHAWDPSCTKLMTVGGPLPYGLRGSYLGLWD
ncbi:hypothetical protein WJX73_010138 [Symbiochloris irregularis]|uniref:DDB1- and CUL4-associated factor 12 beta-propeller domain-containing protein n=1 Tax=Symbiochloris irregularis TaxID=706552 RepID=A0AAW1NYS5_9CHLO